MIGIAQKWYDSFSSLFSVILRNATVYKKESAFRACLDDDGNQNWIDSREEMVDNMEFGNVMHKMLATETKLAINR